MLGRIPGFQNSFSVSWVYGFCLVYLQRRKPMLVLCCVCLAQTVFWSQSLQQYVKMANLSYLWGTIKSWIFLSLYLLYQKSILLRWRQREDSICPTVASRESGRETGEKKLDTKQLRSPLDMGCQSEQRLGQETWLIPSRGLEELNSWVDGWKWF